MIQIKKTILTLVALLAVTTGAWADETPLVTINSTGYTTFTSGSKTFDDKVTVNFSNPVYYNGEAGWYSDWDASQLTVAGTNGYTITSCKFYTKEGSANTGYTVQGESPSVYLSEEFVYTDASQSGVIGYPGINKIEVYGTAPAAAASSGPEVAWDKAEKTGTFKMPGGNVTLQPDYYPQATVAEGAVTAATDAKATTDAPLVTIDETKLTGATKMMYYVSTDATAPAYDAEGWTDVLPTAEKFTEAANLNVWYYPVGTDEGVGEATATYSDGDMNATALTVTIAAEPLWNAEFDLTDAPEEDKAGKWSTDIPEGGVVKGTPVTVTYTGSKKVIGVKAEKKAAAGIVNPVVGQIIGSDGKNYDANATLPSGVTAVAKIAYVGNDAETSTTYNHGLALALGDVSDKKAWCSQYQKTCLTTQYGSADAAKGDMAGIANTDALVNHTGHSHAAASAARDYNGGTHPMGTSEWFLPSAGQWDKMASAAGGYVKLRTNAGLQSDYYWSSTERDASYAWYFSSHNGDWLKDYKDMYSHRVRACLAF